VGASAAPFCAEPGELSGLRWAASDAGGPRGFADMRARGTVAVAVPTTLLETG